MGNVAKELNDDMLARTSPESVAASRTLAYASAGLAGAILIALTQISQLSTALVVSAIGAAVAAPAYVVYAVILGNYVALGPESYGHLREEGTHLMLAVLMPIGLIGLVTALGALCFHLSWAVFVAGSVAVLASLGIHIACQLNLARWWQKNKK
jgi:hypothetical protein